MERSFTITLSNGAYVVGEADAERILAAVERNEPHTLVNADTFGDGLHMSAVRIVTQHVISVIENRAVAQQEHTGRAERLHLRALNGGQPSCSS